MFSVKSKDKILCEEKFQKYLLTLEFELSKEFKEFIFLTTLYISAGFEYIFHLERYSSIYSVIRKISKDKRKYNFPKDLGVREKGLGLKTSFLRTNLGNQMSERLLRGLFSSLKEMTGHVFVFMLITNAC